MDHWRNQLYFGDNLEVLRKHIPVASVDLIYLDPPFNSNATYNVLFAEKNGTKSGAQITAFEDTWHWGKEAEEAFDDAIKFGPKKLADLLLALRSFLGSNDLMAYLTMMAIRLVELHRVLKPTGSFYLHCDPTASHFIKMILDAVFGPMNFRNEVVWKRFHFHADAKRFGRVTDRIFFYTKSSSFTFNYFRIPFSEQYISSKFTHVDKNGRRFRLDNLNPPAGRGPTYEFHGIIRAWRFTQEKMLQLEKEGRIYSGSRIPQLKRYLDELPGQAVHDLWADIPPINPQAKERLGYPTQKPEALLERIIKASSNEGDIVLDPFCGCGTAVAVAERLKRRWIGIDITHLAIKLIKRRLSDTFPTEPPVYEVIGEPIDLKSAEALALEDRYKFEWWALDMVDARPAQDKKKGADRSIDGVIYFQEKSGGKYHKIIVQVKSSQVGVSQIMELKGALEREQAAIGGFLTLRAPTRRMREEAAAAGFYESEHPPGRRFPRVQILTIADLFAGKKLQYPEWSIQATFRKAAPKRKGASPEENQGNLL